MATAPFVVEEDVEVVEEAAADDARLEVVDVELVVDDDDDVDEDVDDDDDEESDDELHVADSAIARNRSSSSFNRRAHKPTFG